MAPIATWEGLEAVSWHEQTCHDARILKTRARRELRDAYRFPGFVPSAVVRGVFGDRVASFPLQSGYKGDFGQTFGTRGNGYSYGWNVDHSSRTFAYSALPGYETVWGAAWSLIQMLPGSSTRWEIALANGTYDVTILAAGYQCQGQLQQIAAEGVLVVNGTAGWDYDTYVGGTQTVSVSDGRPTITNGPSAALNCIDDIQISAH